MKSSKCWNSCQETITTCLCCCRRKRRTGENIFDFSGTKWNIQSREPVIVHDILSNDILDISDRQSVQIKAMIHGIKDNGNLLDNTCELCLEDDAEVGNLGSKLQEYTEERKASGPLPSNEVETSGTTEKPTDQGLGIIDPEGQKSHSAQPEKEQLNVDFQEDKS